MVRSMRQKEVLVASIVGMAMFITDLKFSWLSMYLGTIPGLFVIAFVVGVLATDISGGLLSAFVALVGGVILSVAFFEYLYPELWNPETTLLGLLLFVPMYSLRNMFPDEDMSLAEALTMLVLLLVVTPVMYVISIGMGAIGGIVGRFGRRVVEERFLEKPMASTRSPIDEESAAPPPSEDTSFNEDQGDKD
jgi:hypothetical protein